MPAKRQKRRPAHRRARSPDPQKELGSALTVAFEDAGPQTEDLPASGEGAWEDIAAVAGPVDVKRTRVEPSSEQNESCVSEPPAPAGTEKGDDTDDGTPRVPARPRAFRAAEEFELNPIDRFELPVAATAEWRSVAAPERVREAVRQVVQEGRFIADVARDLGLAPSSIYRWEKRYLDFLTEHQGINRVEDWDDVYTWTGAPEIPVEWKIKFSENWQHLLEVTQAEAADFKQDPLEIFLHNSMLTGWLFRDGRLDRNVALGAGVGVVLVLVLASFLHARLPQSQNVPATHPTIDPIALDQEEIALADPVARAFLGANGWEKKAEFVRDPARVIPLMAAWYQTHPDAGQESENVYYAMRTGDIVNLMVTFDKSNDEPVFLSLVKVNGDYKVDWETSSGYQHESWAELAERRPSEPILLRCLIERSDYYNFEFADPQKWICFRLTYPRGPVTLYGYAERRSKLGSQLDSLVEFNRVVGVMLEAAYLPQSRSSNQVRILKLVHKSWLPGEGTTEETN